jgi:hypothetical protein
MLIRNDGLCVKNVAKNFKKKLVPMRFYTRVSFRKSKNKQKKLHHVCHLTSFKIILRIKISEFEDATVQI